MSSGGPSCRGRNKERGPRREGPGPLLNVVAGGRLARLEIQATDETARAGLSLVVPMHRHPARGPTLGFGAVRCHPPKACSSSRVAARGAAWLAPTMTLVTKGEVMARNSAL